MRLAPLMQTLPESGFVMRETELGTQDPGPGSRRFMSGSAAQFCFPETLYRINTVLVGYW